VGVKIKEVSGKSELIHPGDEIIKINSIPVGDQLDILFHMDDYESVNLVLKKDCGRVVDISVEPGLFREAGILFEEMNFISCRSKCIFCFVDQMAKGLRDSLYQKDDDYRLSFLYGNYITLNDISDKEIDRIIEYHLSPLYVSVHTVNNDIREHLFGRPITNNILAILKRLADGGITIHAQIVVIPGINDGKILEESVKKLAEFYPSCESLAIVPIGLTKHRKGLPEISRFNKKEARKLVKWAEKEDVKPAGDPETSRRFFYLSDEFYFLAEKKIPGSKYYGDYLQLSNGVGMSRLFIEETKNEIEKLKKRHLAAAEFTIVTGKLGYKLINKYIMPMIEANLPELKVGLLCVPNTLFGENVTVSGLLSGRDIIETVKRSNNIFDRIVLPPNSINHNGLLIDDFSPSELQDELQKEILVPVNTFLEDSIITI